MSVPEELDLAGWRRTVSALYCKIRASDDPESAWRLWRETRDDLFANHPQSPLPPQSRGSFPGLTYFEYDPAARLTVEVEPIERERVRMIGSARSRYAFIRFGSVNFELFGHEASLDVFWLEGYGGGLFLPFKDAGARQTTYGGGRYLLDAVKGADLGAQASRLILDFNFAYQPSCAYGGRWPCPLPPRSNRLPFEVPAGERLPEPMPGASKKPAGP